MADDPEYPIWERFRHAREAHQRAVEAHHRAREIQRQIMEDRRSPKVRDKGPWQPGRREQRFLWYLRLTTRYGVGVGGLVWAMVTSHLEPVLLMILGAVATSTDILLSAKELIQTAIEESKVIEEKERRDSQEKSEI